MDLVRKPAGTAVVLKLIGKITIGEGDIALRHAVQQELNAGFHDIVLDLSETSTLDSSGSGELVSAYTAITSRGGRMKLAGLSQKVQDIFQINQLITVFEIYEDAEDALAAINRGE